jgi:hypothetical protein
MQAEVNPWHEVIAALTCSAPIASNLIIGMCIAVAVWLVGGMSTRLAHSLRSLMSCRMFLAAGESARNLGADETGATYLNPAELGIAGRFSAASGTLGVRAAPLVVAWVPPHHGWRSVVLVLPAFAFRIPMKKLLQDPKLWAIIASCALVSVMYSLPTNWTAICFVKASHLILWKPIFLFAWFPPALAILGVESWHSASSARAGVVQWQECASVASRRRFWRVAQLCRLCRQSDLRRFSSA